MRSQFLKLNKSDFYKGLIMAFLTALLTGLYELLPVLNGGAELNLALFKPVILATLGATVSYLLKNLFTNSAGDAFKAERVKNVKKGEHI